MALTLLEANKLNNGNVLQSTIVELYTGSSDIMRVLPFKTIMGGTYGYNTEESLPGIGFRGVNEAYTPSTGVLNPRVETLTIAGGDLDVDAFIIQTRGEEERSVQEAMKVRALGLAWTQKFIKGDNSSNLREFDGLQARLVGDQKFQAGTTANGTPLSLAVLDEAIRRTEAPTHILMSSKMAIKLGAAARNTAVGGYITFGVPELGRVPMFYQGLPIITVDRDGAGNEILPFTEAATSGAATATSVYILSLGDTGVCGLQNGTIDVRDLGELDTAPIYRTRIEWYSTFGVFHGRAATRVWSISDAPITA